MIKITVEELDIVVQASVEQALKEFKKIVPELKRTIKQVEDNLNNVDTKGMINKVQQTVQQVKNKVNEVKNTGISKQLQTQFNKAGASVQKYEGQLEQTREKLRQVYAEMDVIQNRTWKAYTPEGVELGNQAIEPAVNNDLARNKQYQGLSKEATKLEEQIISLNSKLNQTKQEYGQIAGQIQEISSKQSAWGRAVEKVKSTLKSSDNSVSKMQETFKQFPNITNKINTKVTQITKGLKQGLGHILRYAGALFSLQTIYSALSGSANAWLSSQNAAAQQLNANIEYMKYSMGSALAPVIEFVINLVYQLMKAIQSLVYAFSGVNIFANASAKAYSSMANSAKEANKETKQLAGVHSDINNIQSNDSSSGGGGGNVAPDFDLSKIDSDMTSWIDKWKAKLEKFFEPFRKAWEEYGKPLVESVINFLNIIWSLITVIGKSFQEIWENGTVQYTIELVLQILTNIIDIIAAIAEAWKKAWENDGKGTELIQAMANAVNKLLEFVNALATAIKEFASSPIVQEYFQNAIEMVTNFWNALGGLIDFITGIFTGNWEKAWNGMKEFSNSILGLIWNIISEKLLMIKAVIDNALETIKNIWNSIWDGIKKFASSIWDGLLNKIDEIFPGMRNIIETNITNIKNKISEILNNIKTTWSNIWNKIKTTTSNIWNGIWNTIKKPINWILEGIEKMANGIVSGINKLINGLNTMHFTMPDWLGGGTFGINLPTISYVDLPRLAKGAVLKVPTIAEMAEYPGANTNPEIVTPQNIMEETFDKVLSRYQNEDSSPIYLTVNVGNEKLGQMLLDDLRNMKRRSGKDIEALIGG